MNSPTHENRRILIIDDNDAIHQDFRKILVEQYDSSALEELASAIFNDDQEPANPTLIEPFKIDSAYQGMEGLERIQIALKNETPYAMVFVDMRMPPGWDGLETIEEIWEVDSDVQIVICTAYSDYSWKEMIDRLGRSDRLLLLKKPFDAAEVSLMACTLADKWQALQQSRMKLSDLSNLVERRTEALQKANDELMQEIAERKQAEEQAEHLGGLLEGSINEIFVVDAKSLKFTQVNKQARENLGYSMAELQTMNMADIYRDESLDDFRGILEPINLGCDSVLNIETVHQRRDGTTYPVELHLHKAKFQGHEVFTAIILDITERKTAETQLRHEALYDSLTDLPNRIHLLNRLNEELTKHADNPDRKCAVLFLDLDNFKQINDSFGHNSGDHLLIRVAQKLLEVVDTFTDLQSTPSKNMVARLGGDEFVILMSGLGHTPDALSMAEYILKNLEAMNLTCDQEFAIRGSVGVALSDREEDADALLRNADIAMYQAKIAGKSQSAMYDKVMHDVVINRLQLENELRRAIDLQQFELRYQPIIHLESGRLSGFEALVRWNHAEKGIISPIEFIPILEENGMIVPLGRWVLQEACQQMSEWNSRLPDDHRLGINVNVSRCQLRDPSLVDDVKNILQTTKLPGCELRLEITENAIMDDPEANLNVMDQLLELELQLHMDDFGTGHSSLSCLHNFPLNVLKIDRSFVNTMSLSREYSAVVHAIVTLAHNLNMEVTAEGIEKSEQIAQMLALECDYVQGYHFSPPIEAHEAEQMIFSNALLRNSG